MIDSETYIHVLKLYVTIAQRYFIEVMYRRTGNSDNLEYDKLWDLLLTYLNFLKNVRIFL